MSAAVAPDDDGDVLLCDKQAADLAGVSVDLLRAARSTRGLSGPPFVRHGGRVFYREQDVLDWGRRRRVLEFFAAAGIRLDK